MSDEYTKHLIDLHNKGNKKELIRLFIRDMSAVAILIGVAVIISWLK